jgi:hypothetical protein
MFEQNKRLHQMPKAVPLREVVWFTKRFCILQVLWKLLALVSRGVKDICYISIHSVTKKLF